MKLISIFKSFTKLFLMILLFTVYLCGTVMAANIPAVLETITADDGSTWERVTNPGFGDSGNVGIVALRPFNGSLYALTRNDTTGFELWRTSGTSWERITVPGFTDDNNYYGFYAPYDLDEFGPSPTIRIKYNLKQNIWADMIEYKGYLYVAQSTGYQGGTLFGSLGFELWRFNGSTWEPVVTASFPDVSGTISAISGCDSRTSGATTAQITDASKNWTPDELAGCIVRVFGSYNGTEGTEPGTPSVRVFNIISNTSNTLTVQQNEAAGSATEYTICSEFLVLGDAGRPSHIVPAIAVNDNYIIECGIDASGFGEMWNKSVVDLEVFNDELYLSIGLNYESGTRIWKTDNGINWTPSSLYSFGLFHGYTPGYPPTTPTGICLIAGLESRNGTPVSSSATTFGKSSVTGTQTLFIGGTGSSGCNGRGARVFRLDAPQWTPIVDYFVDSNNAGTNENGFGDDGGSNFNLANFQAWSWAEYDGKLFTGIARLQNGCRMMYTATGSTADGAWAYAVGGSGSTKPANAADPTSDGFGSFGINTINGKSQPKNLMINLFTYNSALYAGTAIDNLRFTTSGAELWKATGPANNLTWTKVTGNGFGDTNICQYEAFTVFNNILYLVASDAVYSNFIGEILPGSTGAKIYRQVSPTLVNLSSFEAQGYWRRIVLTWKTESEINNAGFNIYRAESEAGEYMKINSSLIPANGSTTEGANYSYIDQTAKRGTTYYYKLEDVDMSGNATMHGPVSATPWAIF